VDYNVSLEDFTPAPRYPPVVTPWTTVQIEESTSSDGPWTVIDTFALDPVDTDPANPAVRSFTTENATLQSGWYRVAFLDAADRISYADPVTNPTSGSAYFTVAELRARYPDLADDTAYPDVLVEEYRELAEQAFEDACDRAFVPRVATDTVTEDRSYRWERVTRTDFSTFHGRKLNQHDIRRVLAATDSTGIALDITAAELNHGWVYGLPSGGTITITYEYGLDTPPLRVKHAVMALAREWMLSGPVTDRQTGIPVEGGGVISLALPGGWTGTFGLSEVDECVRRYGVSQVFVG
jgi:hypothetical protein